MTSPRSYQTEAIIIKHADFREADRIITLYSLEKGKLRAIVRGARHPKSKLAGHLELLTYTQVMLARGRNLDIVIQCQTLDSFLPLKSDLWRTSHAFYIAELIDAFTVENSENSPLFTLLLETLQRLCQSGNVGLILRYFELWLLDYVGYRPELRKCVSCNLLLKPTTNFFSSASGGVICSDCAYKEPTARSLTLNALKVLRFWQNCDYAAASRVRVNSELASELEAVMREYLSYLLERQIKSAVWLDKLRTVVFDKNK